MQERGDLVVDDSSLDFVGKSAIDLAGSDLSITIYITNRTDTGTPYIIESGESRAVERFLINC